MLPGWLSSCSPSGSRFTYNEHHITEFASITDWEILVLNKHYGGPNRSHATVHHAEWVGLSDESGLSSLILNSTLFQVFRGQAVGVFTQRNSGCRNKEKTSSSSMRRAPEAHGKGLDQSEETTAVWSEQTLLETWWHHTNNSFLFFRSLQGHRVAALVSMPDI